MSLVLTEEQEILIFNMARQNRPVKAIAAAAGVSGSCVRICLKRPEWRPRTREEREAIDGYEPPPEELEARAAMEKIRSLEKLLNNQHRKNRRKITKHERMFVSTETPPLIKRG